jgi:hypothetical protein
MLNKRLKLAIVGNSPPKKNYSEEIDSADFVVRFSKMDHLDNGLVGTRTDLLIINPNNHFFEKGILNLSDKKKIIYSKTNVFFRESEKMYLQKIIDILGIKRYGFLKQNLLFELLDKNYGWSGDGNLNTTTGLLFVVHSILNMPEYHPSLYCFGYDGFFGPFEFDEEINVVLSMSFNRLVNIVI